MTRGQMVVAVVALAVPLLGLLTEIILRQFTMRGYREIAVDAASILRRINGEFDRDGDDLLLRGLFHSWPVLLRFSHAEERPGLNIELPVPCKASLFCVPKEYKGVVGRVALRAPGERLARFQITTNHPNEARLLLSMPSVTGAIEKLWSSSGTLLALEEQRLELSESVIPQEDLSGRVLSSIQGMVGFAEVASQMLGEKPIPAAHFGCRWNWFRTAYIVAPILLISSMVVAARVQRPALPAPAPVIPAGISKEEAAQMPDVEHWRVAQPSDFDPGAASWLRQQGQVATGRIPVPFSSGGVGGVAYVLENNGAPSSAANRLVLFYDGKLKFDITLPRIAIAARVPSDKIASIQWNGQAPVGQPNGDGVLIVRKLTDPSSGMVMFFSGEFLLSGNPRDYQTLSLQ